MTQEGCRPAVQASDRRIGARRLGRARWACAVSCTVLVALVFSAPAVRGDPRPRTKLVLYPYHGVGGLDAATSAADLEFYLKDKVRTLYAGFAAVPEAAYLADLHIERGESRPGTPAEYAAEWRRLHALLLLDGAIAAIDGGKIARSGIYFGELGAGIPGRAGDLVHLDLPLSAAEYGSIADTHSAAALYGLAVDAKENGLPGPFYAQIASRGLEILGSLEPQRQASPDLKRLRCGLLSVISVGTGSALPAGC